MKILLLIVILFISTQVRAYQLDPWRTEDTIRQSLLVSLAIVDYMQTLEYVKYPERGTEGNPMLNKHPSRRELLIYGTTVLLIHTTITRLLPTRYYIRDIFQYLAIGIESTNVYLNFRVSTKIYPPWG